MKRTAGVTILVLFCVSAWLALGRLGASSSGEMGSATEAAPESGGTTTAQPMPRAVAKPRETVPPAADVARLGRTADFGAAGAPANPPPSARSDEVAPLIAAIRSRHPDMLARRAAMLEALERSGSSSESWTAPASQTFESWRQQMPSAVRGALVLEPPRCYRAGCAVEVKFRSLADYEQAAQSFRTLPDAGHGHGGRVQTPAQPQGQNRLVATWIMLRPFEAG